ncbi:MAG: tRNA (adenosine(37)-N6)-threonylcarbamoyltransferase complex dimerization subunit type 1 TsaB [Chloroflexota bacterium]|nr:MAG: tRNA (adenosine(37)-N6)-threonylcarbamoyltransferase complex dimerization subunit type 1 TsaB [Chloroflexota bacterium]
MELAIDTSTDFCGIGLSHQGETIAEKAWHSGQSHTVELVPNIVRLLDQVKISPQSLHAVFVAKGPGSFNGLRVGISTAKGLAFALKIPLVGISTLEIEAYPFAFTKLPICPIHNAGRGEVAAALYLQNNDWRCITPEHITTADTLCQQIRRRTLFCGEIPPHVIEQLQQRLGRHAIIPDPAARLRHACYMAALGWQRLNRGQYDNPASLQPLYLRQPPITQRKVK